MITEAQLKEMESELHSRLVDGHVDVVSTADFATRALRWMISEYRNLQESPRTFAKRTLTAQD